MHPDELKTALLALAKSHPAEFRSLIEQVLKEVPAVLAQTSVMAGENENPQVDMNRFAKEPKSRDNLSDEAEGRLSMFRQILKEDAALLNRLAQ